MASSAPTVIFSAFVWLLNHWSPIADPLVMRVSAELFWPSNSKLQSACDDAERIQFQDYSGYHQMGSSVRANWSSLGSQRPMVVSRLISQQSLKIQNKRSSSHHLQLSSVFNFCAHCVCDDERA